MRSYVDMVLAAALPKPQPNGTPASHLEYIIGQQVDESYFTGSYKWLWKAAIDASLFDSGLDEDIIRARMDEWKCDQSDISTALLLFLDLKTVDVPKDKLKVILPQFKNEVHSEKFANILEDSARILTQGISTPNGVEVGFKDARKYIITQISELEAKESRVLPTQDLQDGVADFLAEYTAAKNCTTVGVKTGFHHIDSLTNGIQRGELWVMCGFTGDGKSQFLLNSAYNAATKDCKNVVYVSLEMPLHQVRRRLFVRHSNEGRFGLHGGLDYVRVKRGSLNIDEEKVLHEVVSDLATGGYGRLTMLQMAKTETVDSLRERLTYARSRMPIDLVVLDYAPLLSAGRRRTSRQDEIIEIIEALKSLALNFNEGEAVGILTAQQTSRKAKEEAVEQGEYGLNFAADTSAIEKNADFLAWLLRTEELEAGHEIRIGVSKYRDGAAGLKFEVFERYSSCLLDNLNDSGLSITL